MGTSINEQKSKRGHDTVFSRQKDRALELEGGAPPINQSVRPYRFPESAVPTTLPAICVWQLTSICEG